MENQFYKRFATAVLRSRPQIIQAQRAFTNRKKIKYEKNGSSRLTDTYFCPWCQTTSRIKPQGRNGLTEEVGVGERPLASPSPSPLPFFPALCAEQAEASRWVHVGLPTSRARLKNLCFRPKEAINNQNDT